MIDWKICKDGESLVATEQILGGFSHAGFVINPIIISFNIVKVGSPNVPFQIWCGEVYGSARIRTTVNSIEEGKIEAEKLIKAVREFYI